MAFSQATAAGLLSEYGSLLRFHQLVDSVCRDIVVSSDLSSLGSLFRSTGVMAVYSGLGQAVCSFIAWNRTVDWDPLYDNSAFFRQKLQVFQQLVDQLVKGVRN